jgi:hypothetical protein
MNSAKKLCGAAGALFLAAALPAGASISFTVTPVSLSLYNDDGTVTPSSSLTVTAGDVGSDTLTPASSTTFKLNVGDSGVSKALTSLAWVATDQLGGAEFTYTYGIYVDGSGGSSTKIGQISQDGLLIGDLSSLGISGANSLTLENASTKIQFSFGGTTYDLYVALPGGLTTQNPGASSSVSVGGGFSLSQVTVVPEPSTGVAGAGAVGLLLMGVLGHSKRSVARVG